MTVVLFQYAKKPRPPGHVIGLAALMYAPVRFGLDFLRATDVALPDQRYAGLTPAQSLPECRVTLSHLADRSGSDVEQHRTGTDVHALDQHRCPEPAGLHDRAAGP